MKNTISNQAKVVSIGQELQNYLHTEHSERWRVSSGYSKDFSEITFVCEKTGQTIYIDYCNGKWNISGNHIDADIAVDLLHITRTNYAALFQENEANKYKYIVIDGKLEDYEEYKNLFFKEPDDYRWKYGNSFEEYCRQLKYAVTGEICTPSEYAAMVNHPCVLDGISVERFDVIFADVFGLWNYCLEDASETVENGLSVVPVRFADGTIRLAELPEKELEQDIELD